ncbi:MAG: Tfp pilus assembly protein FimT/FimU [Vicinamibacterales bacterium]
MSPRSAESTPRGFSLVELLIVIAVFGIVVAVGMPMFGAALESSRLSASARDVERELQTARLKAVTAKRPIRVRFNCPRAGEFRMVELIGSTSAPASEDMSTDRCSPETYPYPSQGTTRLDRPQHDGPLRALTRGTVFTSAQTIEFRPDGTAHADLSGSNPWPVIPASTPVSIIVSRNGATKTITVNGLGKIRIQ